MSKVLTVVGQDSDGHMMEFHVVNPMNLVIRKGTVSKPGQMTDGEGNPIMIEEERTFVHVGGAPLLSTESVEDVIAKVKAL